jgi:hypothetical protein
MRVSHQRCNRLQAQGSIGHVGELPEWLVEQIKEKTITLIGIDHGFSFPLRYFEIHHL